MASGQISLNHYRPKNHTNIHHIQWMKSIKNAVSCVSRWFYGVKRFIFLYSTKPLWYNCKPRPQVAYCDVISIIWMFHFAQNHLESHSAHFPSRSFLSVSTNPLSILRFLPQACCDLPPLRAQTESLKDFFFSFTTDPPSSIQAFTHRIL